MPNEKDTATAAPRPAHTAASSDGEAKTETKVDAKTETKVSKVRSETDYPYFGLTRVIDLGRYSPDRRAAAR